MAGARGGGGYGGRGLRAKTARLISGVTNVSIKRVFQNRENLWKKCGYYVYS